MLTRKEYKQTQLALSEFILRHLDNDKLTESELAQILQEESLKYMKYSNRE